MCNKEQKRIFYPITIQTNERGNVECTVNGQKLIVNNLSYEFDHTGIQTVTITAPVRFGNVEN